PNGSTYPSAGFDRLILSWNVYGDCDNSAILKGHSGAVMELHNNTDGSMLFSASTDKTVAVWDSETGERVKRLKGHTSFVNSCYLASFDQIISCGIDNDIKVWDLHQNKLMYTMTGHADSVTGLSLSSEGSCLLSNAMDNTVLVWD
ncbi:hypothetical protein EGM_10963, partial [Macaca fascicularis]